MIRFATYGFAAALLGAAATANAETVTSMVRSFDASGQTIVLDDGRSYPVQPGLDTTGLQEGVMVTVNIEDIGGTEIVTEVRLN